MWRVPLFVLAILTTSSDAAVLTVYPHVVFAGHGVRVTCRVPRHEANREVSWGFEHWTSTTRQLDGANSPITWTSIFNEVPCDPGRAFCAVQRVGGRTTSITSPLLVAGCGEATNDR